MGLKLVVCTATLVLLASGGTLHIVPEDFRSPSTNEGKILLTPSSLQYRLAWIHSFTRYSRRGRIPIVAVLPLRYVQDVCRVMAVSGCYFPSPQEVVWIASPLREDVLVHELVHAVQDANGAFQKSLTEREMACLEFEAHRVTEAYLRAHYIPMPVGWSLHKRQMQVLCEFGIRRE